MSDTNIDELIQYLEDECIQAFDVFFDREKAKTQIKQLITEAYKKGYIDCGKGDFNV